MPLRLNHYDKCCITNSEFFIMKKIILFAISFLISFSFVSAQQIECGAMEYLEYLKIQDPNLENKMLQNEQTLQNWIKTHAPSKLGKKSTIITIPVVVHVVYKNPTENISTAQIFSALDIINKDFRRLNADTSATPSVFAALAADCEIEFCLTTIDPNGNATSGITRTPTTITSFDPGTSNGKSYSNDLIKYTASGGIDAWNTSQYLNIWVCDLSSLNGYSTFPGAPASADGVVIDHTRFGDIGTAAGNPFIIKTTSHEIGHFLNLYHIWGPTNGPSNCGNDSCNDTPTESSPTYGTPLFPYNTFSACNSGANGEMFMNYMDYTDCRNIFTQDQKSRMIAAINIFRPGLLNYVCQPGVIYGCTDPLACNYSPLANVNVDCNYNTCAGCMDSAAYSYDSLATISDTASCLYCNVSASAVVVNASSASALNGSVDLTVTGWNCITPTSLASNFGASSTGSAGIMFNMINTSGNPLTITGISQGSYGSYFGAARSYSIYYYPGSFVPHMSNQNGWIAVATNASGTVPSGGTPTVPVYSGAIPMKSVTIPVGATYGFYLGLNGILTYTIATGVAGLTPWGSNRDLTITLGRGGDFPNPLYTPRAPLIQVYYGTSISTLTYQWSNGATIEDLTGVTAGTYSVTATDCNGCKVSKTFNVGVGLGLREERLNLISINPNPAKSKITVKADAKLLGSDYIIHDLLGKTVLIGKLNSENTIIELGNLSGGIYLLSIEDNNLKQTFKVIKE